MTRSTRPQLVRLGLLAATALIATALTALPAAPAAADSWFNDLCYSNPNAANCDGTDPADTHCSADAYTANSVPITLGAETVATLNIRYSPHCGTNWAQVVMEPGSTAQIAVQACRYDPSEVCSNQATVYNSSYAYSDQIYARTVTAWAYGWVTFAGAGTGGMVSA